MAVSGWTIDFKDIEKLEEKMKKIPGESEKVLNAVLHGDGIDITMENIQPNIPISTWKNRVRNKKHARNYKALTSTKSNLEFTVRPKPSFDYLKWPDLGIGTSIRNKPKEFMAEGLEKATPKILDTCSQKLEEAINRTLGG